jgi:hypothetical protein
VVTPIASAAALAGRYLLREQLGAGAMGTVFRAHDQQRGVPVAIKILPEIRAAALYSFKREFRDLADLVHPNLVTLYELAEWQGTWFLAMELIEGAVNFLDHLRPASVTSPPTETLTRELIGTTDVAAPVLSDHPVAEVDYDRLRAAMRQLCTGVAALHSAGKLHRDLKPSNVLVTPARRVVICDFGLVADVAARDTQRRNDGWGTPAYMAPEACAGGEVGPHSDWYSVGVMLFQALTGRLPFAGNPQTVAARKQQVEPTPPVALLPTIPEQWNSLCLALLQRDPSKRMRGSELLAALGGTMEGAAGPITEPSLVGREEQLDALHQAFATAQRGGRCVAAFVCARSGMGKSALVRTFLQQLRERHAALWIMEGRCYERESVPYKAMDPIVDSLASQLTALPAAELEAVLPVDIGVLARLFPVLLRLPPLRSTVQDEAAATDAIALRRTAAQTLRQLLARLQRTRPVVLWIDDLQWGDMDSATLLAELIYHPESPPVLLIASYRAEDVDAPLVRTLLEHERGTSEVVPIDLLPLTEAEVLQLANELIGVHATPAIAREITRDSEGSPFFAAELLRARADQRLANETVSMDTVLSRRFAALPDDALALLQTIAVAARPVPALIAGTAAGVATEVAAVTLLAGQRLIRVRAGTEPLEIESFHDRIRETVVSRLDDTSLRSCHRRLADALEAWGQADAETLLAHCLGAGEPARATVHALAAADRASRALAFDRAARLYQVALDLDTLAPDRSRQVRTQRADALVNAGRGSDAAAEYLVAAQGADPDMVVHCESLAAEHLLVSGHIESGLQVLTRLCRAVGVRMPRARSAALFWLLWHRFQLRLRDLRWTPKPADQLSRREQVRLRVHRAAGTLGMIDTIRGAEFHARGLRLALEIGEPIEVARAIAHEATYLASQGLGMMPRAERYMAQAKRILQQHPSEWLSFYISVTEVFLLVFGNRMRDALELAQRCVVTARRFPGNSWGESTARIMEFNCLRALGEYSTWRQRYDVYLTDITERGDRYAETTLRCLSVGLWLAEDRPDMARGELALIDWNAPEASYHVQKFYEVSGRIEIALYEGDIASAIEATAGWRSTLRRGLLLRVRVLRQSSAWLDGRVALAAAVARHDRRFLRCAKRRARELEREPAATASPMTVLFAALLRAGIACQEQQTAAAAGWLRRAADLADQIDYRTIASAARWQRARLLGDDPAATLAEFRQLGVVDAARLSAMLVPGISAPAAR